MLLKRGQMLHTFKQNEQSIHHMLQRYIFVMNRRRIYTSEKEINYQLKTATNAQTYTCKLY